MMFVSFHGYCFLARRNGDTKVEIQRVNRKTTGCAEIGVSIREYTRKTQHMQEMSQCLSCISVVSDTPASLRAYLRTHGRRAKRISCGDKVSFYSFMKDISMTYDERENGEKSR